MADKVSPGLRKFGGVEGWILCAHPIPNARIPPHQTGTAKAAQRSGVGSDAENPRTARRRPAGTRPMHPQRPSRGDCRPPPTTANPKLSRRVRGRDITPPAIRYPDRGRRQETTPPGAPGPPGAPVASGHAMPSPINRWAPCITAYRSAQSEVGSNQMPVCSGSMPASSAASVSASAAISPSVTGFSGGRMRKGAIRPGGRPSASARISPTVSPQRRP